MIYIIHLLIGAFVISLPVVLAGLFFILILKKRWFIFLRKPIDFNISIMDKRILGDNKTLLGPIIMGFGSIVAGIMLSITGVFCTDFTSYLCISFNKSVVFFFLIGLAYSFGELPNSFMKRMLNINPGIQARGKIKKTIFYILDKTDSIFAVAIVATIIYKLNLAEFIAIVVVGTTIHLLTDILMIRINLK